MSLTFYYDFYDDTIGDSDRYVFEAPYKDAIDYIKRTHTNDEILTDYANTLYPLEDDENKETYKEYGFDGTEESIRLMDDDMKKDLVNEIMYDMVNEIDIYDNELKDYFEQEAYDEKTYYDKMNQEFR